VAGVNEFVIWATDLNGQLRLIVRTGDLFDVNDDPLVSDLRTISFLTFQEWSGNEDGRRSAFNDLGQLAFHASFTDGTSGIFVSNLVAVVPEPRTLVVSVATGLLALRRYRCASF
jgi:hypothetical protein